MIQRKVLADKPSEKILWILIRALVYFWVYNGFLRLIIFKDYANYLYFMPTLILIFIYIVSFSLPVILRKYFFFASITLALITSFQAFHIFKGDLDLKIAFYGWALYQAPVLLLTVVPFAAKMNFYDFFQKMLRYSLTPNLILSFFQATNQFSSLVTSFENTQQLTSANGYIRSFGTFTSTTGFSLYLTVVTCVMLVRGTEIRTMSRNIAWAQIALLYFLSGSRTVFFSLIPVVIAALFCRKNKLSSRMKINYFTVFPVIAISFFIINQVKPGPFLALIQRFSVAKYQENTTARIYGSLFSYTQHMYDSLWGSGLGSRAVGAYDYLLNIGWIEDDHQRTIAEAGSILGIVMILCRYLVVLNILFYFFKNNSKIPREFLIVFSSILPMLLFGQLFGQSSISLGTWIVLFVILIEKYKGERVNMP